MFSKLLSFCLLYLKNHALAMVCLTCLQENNGRNLQMVAPEFSEKLTPISYIAPYRIPETRNLNIFTSVKTSNLI
jgi:hypothetical protein